ncbi:histidine kinase, partial [Symplocastrum sp. BBK-W-15]|nr:histidine kinase [Limnofasciculus baicalensis BBK-W-15]
MNYTFYLKVQRVENTCIFELSWGKGQQLTVTLPYPENLSTLYQEWSSVYLSFYKQALRGRVAKTGSLGVPPIDWHAKLVQAEATLLYEFHQWLRSAQLFEIRSRIARGGVG